MLMLSVDLMPSSMISGYDSSFRVTCMEGFPKSLCIDVLLSVPFIWHLMMEGTSILVVGARSRVGREQALRLHCCACASSLEHVSG